MRIGIITFPGSLDDVDAARAVRLAGGEPVALWHADHDLKDVDAVILPGGFSYGDYLRAGAIAARAPLMQDVVARAHDGMPVLGICNGFQVLCEAGLLPGALLPNVERRFVCRQVNLEVVRATMPFTADCSPGELLSIPVKHTTGRYYAPPEVLEILEADGQILLRYAHDGNPNGSSNDIAGVRNAYGNVFGLMPHPEHAVDPLTGSVDGLKIFSSMAHAQG